MPSFQVIGSRGGTAPATESVAGSNNGAALLGRKSVEHKSEFSLRHQDNFFGLSSPGRVASLLKISGEINNPMFRETPKFREEFGILGHSIPEVQT